MNWTPQVRGSGGWIDGDRVAQDGKFWFTELVGEPDRLVCAGYGTVRLEGDLGRGTGVYRFDLPRDPVLEAAEDPWWRMGGLTIGFSNWQHIDGGLHRNGSDGSGGLSPPGADGKGAACAIVDDMLFVDSDTPWPGVTIGNFHWTFAFRVPASVVA